MKELKILALVAALPGLAGALAADDWTAWRGPGRDGKSTETGLLERWPEGGPKRLWRASGAGKGYSTVAISGDRFLTMGNVEGDEYAVCFSVEDGSRLWRVKTGKPFRNDRGSGPRSTPTIEGDRFYALGASGDLSCRKLADGSAVWSVNILERFDAENARWGLSESVLVEGDMVICTPGGRGSTVAALDKRTGKTIWKTEELRDRAGYASPIAGTIAGVRQIVSFNHSSTAGIRARDGKLLWRYTDASNGIANCATPIIHGDRIFVTSDYGQGSALLEISKQDNDVKSREIYFTKDLQNHHGGVILVDGVLYGHSGGNNARHHKFVALDFASGEIKWSGPGPGKASIIYADRHLYCLSENGIASLVEVNPERYIEKGRFVFKTYTRFKTGGIGEDDEKPTWTHPVVCGKRLYLRDQDDIACYDIAAR